MLRNKFKNNRIILGSQSPRRKELLQGLDIDFITIPLNADEQYSITLRGSEITEYLCQVKAKAYTHWQENDILITSDTIVWLNGKPLEKPKDKQGAIQMLKSMSNTTHDVITSVGIFAQKKEKIFTDIARVTFGELTDDEIGYYVTRYKPYDKAGAYGVQEWIGYMGVKRIEGSYYTIMGMPVYKLYHALKEF